MQTHQRTEPQTNYPPSASSPNVLSARPPVALPTRLEACITEIM